MRRTGTAKQFNISFLSMFRGVIVLLLLAVSGAGAETFAVDSVQFGNAASEQEHGLEAALSTVIEGELGEPARRLLPPEETDWRGGSLTFTMNVDPDTPNYFTAKFWGGETCSEEAFESRLCLFIDDKQVGHRHLGEVEFLDIMFYKSPRYPGRFFYKTLPLPLHMTKGKSSVELRIEGQGGINGYRPKIEEYQKMMIEPSRGIYRGYVHTEPCISPADDEVQGSLPAELPVRTEPGEELLDELKASLNDATSHYMSRSGKMHVDSMQFLAHAYCTPWSIAYRNPKALERLVESLDAHYLDYRDNPESIVGKRWIHKGPAGDAVRLIHRDLKPYLNKMVPGKKVLRSKAWGDLFVASRNYNAARRRSYTNQSMISDLNTYYCNLAAQLLRHSKAWPEDKARLLFYESMGLEPWSGHWDERAKPDWSRGKDRLLLTEMGLTRELGYVGAYGEIVSDFGVMMYEATKPAPDKEGDKRLKEQLIKMCRARAPFRYPLLDKKGYRCMNLEAVIGWRDWKYPGIIIYDQVNGRDGGAFDAAISTGDRVLMGYGQQMVEDNQFFAKLQERMERQDTKGRTYLLPVPERYETIAALPAQPYRLPMTDGQPGSVFADTENGVIAVKNGDDILYASLYWRARTSINNLARVHYLTPEMERDATVNIETRFKDSGHTYTIPDWTNQGFGRGREEDFYRYQDMYLAMAGQKQPIAEVPKGDKTYEPGQENLHAGKGDLYLMQYGSYFVAMNCTDKESYHFELPPKFVGAKDLVSGQVCSITNVEISPKQIIVLHQSPAGSRE